MPRKTKPVPDPLKILFIGNSFTARNDLPGLITALAATRGRRVESKLLSVNGAALRLHWNAGEAAREIAAGGYHWVVLQEQSTLPYKNAKRMAENVALFHEVIKAAGARTALYMTWARQHAPETQAVITDAYTGIGAALGATVVPAGVVWEKFLKSHTAPALYDKDGSHPTLAGSYLAACVFLRTLIGEDPIGCPAPPKLSAEDAVLLQRAV